MSYLAKDKWVRVMTDYSSDGLWAKDGCAVDDQELPVSTELKQRLSVWCANYEKSEFYLPPEERRNGQFDLIAHGKEGRDIARAIKAELPDWTVVYFDEAVLEIVGRDAPRGSFEYEIVSP